MKIKLHWQIIIGMVLGVLWALLSAKLGWSSFTIDWIKPFGTIFINLLKLVALPLILFSVIGGIINIGHPSRLGKMGGKTLGIYLVTTLIAVSTGLILVNIIQPGKFLSEETRRDYRIEYELWAQENKIEVKDATCLLCDETNQEDIAAIQLKMDTTVLGENVAKKLATAEKTINAGPLQPLVDVVPKNIFTAMVNSAMLPVIFFAIFFGIATLYIPEKQAAIITKAVNAFNEVFLKMIDFIIKMSPFLVFALTAGILADMAGDDLSKIVELFKGLSVYALTVFLGLSFMVFVLYPVFLKLTKKNLGYFEFFRKMAPAQLLAFSSSSSAATLPVTIECVEENLKVNKKVSSFVLPIGATVNMDGTSLYQAVAAIFLAQIHMIDLTVGQQLTIVLTATLASIGSAAVPSAGLVMLMIVLSSVGLNPAWIAIIIPVDRILDMCRTTVNVTGDATVATIIDASSSEGDV